MSYYKGKIKVGITMGDPSGIGPCIIKKALPVLEGLADFTIIGDKWVYGKVKSHKSEVTRCPFIDLGNVKHKSFSFGRIKAEYGRASIEYLDKAMELIRTREIDCLVTCPISKEAINLAGLRYSGHTEYLADKTGKKDPVMMLLNKRLKISLVTRHIPLREVSPALNRGNIRNTIKETIRGLKVLFGIKRPRIVVCGLNPHASDNGIIGNEENRVIKPLIRRLGGNIADIYGPVSSDIAMQRLMSSEYDCAIAMYHDQALIPLKLCLNMPGVNLTLGLGFTRTSVLHGTAFDIADTHSADPASLIEAVKLSVKCTQNLKKD